ncbi:MAG: hypothetical protein MR936_13170 [Eubacterium sp.]|nr:hypothetical protein [Eubacterium sp.]
MKLKERIDYAKFLDTVKICNRDVFFETLDGDQLNLNSTLSRFLFSTVCGHEGIIKSGMVRCQCEEDKELLKEFIAE